MKKLYTAEMANRFQTLGNWHYNRGNVTTAILWWNKAKAIQAEVNRHFKGAK